MNEIRRILHPTDFSDSSERALRYAIDLAARLGAGIDVVHVYQLPVYTMPDGALLATPELVAKLTTDAQRDLGALVTKLNERGVDVTTHLREGVPHAEIGKAATDLGDQLIVMGTHGRSGLTHLLLGSTAERVVRTSAVPVLTVPTPKE